MIIGYARVSTAEQNLDSQCDALKKFGCEKITQEKISSVKLERPALKDLLSTLLAGDTLVIWKLDRLGRNLKELVAIVNDLSDRRVGLVSLQDPIDTTTAQGRLVFNIFASLAEFERDVIRARTKAGLDSARARGRLGGRPKGLSKAAIAKTHVAEKLYTEGELSIAQICRELNICKRTLYSYLSYRNVKVSNYNPKARVMSLG